MAGFDRFSYPGVEIESKTKQASVDKVELEIDSAVVDKIELETKRAAPVDIEGKTQSEIALRGAEPEGP